MRYIQQKKNKTKEVMVFFFCILISVSVIKLPEIGWFDDLIKIMKKKKKSS